MCRVFFNHVNSLSLLFSYGCTHRTFHVRVFYLMQDSRNIFAHSGYPYIVIVHFSIRRMTFHCIVCLVISRCVCMCEKTQL